MQLFSSGKAKQNDKHTAMLNAAKMPMGRLDAIKQAAKIEREALSRRSDGDEIRKDLRRETASYFVMGTGMGAVYTSTAIGPMLYASGAVGSALEAVGVNVCCYIAYITLAEKLMNKRRVEAEKNPENELKGQKIGGIRGVAFRFLKAVNEAGGALKAAQWAMVGTFYRLFSLNVYAKNDPLSETIKNVSVLEKKCIEHLQSFRTGVAMAAGFFLSAMVPITSTVVAELSGKIEGFTSPLMLALNGFLVLVAGYVGKTLAVQAKDEAGECRDSMQKESGRHGAA